MPNPAEPSALAVALESESLQALYSAWLELRVQHAAARAARAREAQQLDQRTDYLVKTVAAARTLPDAGAPTKKSKAPKKSSSLARQDPLAAFHAKAEAELTAARRELAAREKSEEREAAAVEARVRKALLARADQHLSIHRPAVTLTVHPVGSTQVILEVAAPGDEDAVLLMRALHGRLPTRWGFFSDDAVEDLSLGPPRFYPDEGLSDVWPKTADAEDAILFAPGDFVPARQQIPFALPRKKFPRYRLVHHGPVGQIEARRAKEPYQHLLRREDGELLSGYLLRLELAGRIKLELKVG